MPFGAISQPQASRPALRRLGGTWRCFRGWRPALAWCGAAPGGSRPFLLGLMLLQPAGGSLLGPKWEPTARKGVSAHALCSQSH